MVEKKSSLRGMRDLYGETFERHATIIRIATECVQRYGFSGIETPIVESTSVFQRSLGDTSDIIRKEMYTFLDRGGDSITLRPEGTAPVIRALVSNNLLTRLPQKVFYTGPMFRYERPQKGRYRQFYQFSVEWVGTDHPFSDVETIACAHDILKNLGVSFSLRINTLGDRVSRQTYRNHLATYFKKHFDALSIESQIRLERNPLRILDSKDPSDRKICEDAPTLFDHLSNEARLRFHAVCRGLDHLKISYTVDHSLVRGLDYYVHTVYECTSSALGSQDAFLGGGRYDGLVEEMGGTPLEGLGWSIGIDRLAMILAFEKKASKEIMIIPVTENDRLYALDVAQKLRLEGKETSLSYAKNVTKALRDASRDGIGSVIIIGENERNSGKWTLKNLNHH